MAKTFKDVIHYWQSLPDEAINQMRTNGEDVCHAEHAARFIFDKKETSYSEWVEVFDRHDLRSLLRDHGAPWNPFGGVDWGDRQEVYKRVLENGDPEILDKPIPRS